MSLRSRNACAVVALALAHLTARRDEVWFTTAGGVAEQYAALFPLPADGG